jgi:hypothetical protein
MIAFPRPLQALDAREARRARGPAGHRQRLQRRPAQPRDDLLPQLRGQAGDHGVDVVGPT